MAKRSLLSERYAYFSQQCCLVLLNVRHYTFLLSGNLDMYEVAIYFS